MLKYIKLCKSAIIFKLRGCWSCWRSESIETWVISKQFTMTFPHYILVFVISILFIYITYISISRDEKIVIDLKECLIKECVINNFVVTYINNLFLLSLNVLCSIKIYFVNWVILQLISWGSHYLSCFNQDFLFLFNDMKGLVPFGSRGIDYFYAALIKKLNRQLSYKSKIIISLINMSSHKNVFL